MEVAVLRKTDSCTMVALEALPHSRQIIVAVCTLHIGGYHAMGKCPLAKTATGDSASQSAATQENIEAQVRHFRLHAASPMLIQATNCPSHHDRTLCSYVRLLGLPAIRKQKTKRKISCSTPRSPC